MRYYLPFTIAVLSSLPAILASAHATGDPATEPTLTYSPRVSLHDITQAQPAHDGLAVTAVAVVRIRPLDVHTLKAESFGDWDQSDNDTPAIGTRRR